MEASKLDGNPRRTVNGAGGDPIARVRPLPLPPSKAQYRPAYRRQPPPVRRRSRRRCCCCCFLWLILILIALVFIAAILAGVFYVVYHPLPPSFTLSSLRLSALNVSVDALTVTSRIDLTVTARNPNGKLVLDYGDVAVTAYSDGVAIGDGTIPGFVHGTGTTTAIKVAVASTGWSLDPADAADLRSRKGKFPLEIDFDTVAGVRIGGIKTKRVGVRAFCDGILAAVDKSNSTATFASPPAESPQAAPAATSPPSAVSPPAVKCKVKLHIKIFGWTI